MPALAADFQIGLAQFLRRGEGDGVDEKIEPAVDVANFGEDAAQVGILSARRRAERSSAHAARQAPARGARWRARQMGKGQLGPLGVKRLADGPSDAAIVGHAHYQADLAGEDTHVGL